MPPNLDHATLSLSDLQRNRAADATLKNLLSTLTDQIQTCSKLAVFEYEAGSEGHSTLALAFRELGETERASFDSLLEQLRRHLNELQREVPPAPVRHTSTQAVNR